MGKRPPAPSPRPHVDAAEVVIIGGGIIGSSIAYHLCCAGITDVLVLERNRLSGGATARAAGLLLHLRSETSTIAMISRTRAAVGELEERLGESLDYRQVGCIRAVSSESRVAELEAMEACAKSSALTVETIDAADARRLCPWLELGPMRRIAFVREDGYIDGARLGTAYARAARAMGARIRQGVDVLGIVRDEHAVVGVGTDAGPIRAAWVIAAAGAWNVLTASRVGWGFPAAPTRSHYWITAPDGSGAAGRPSVQLPDLRAYLRCELGGMVVGLQEPRSRTYDPMTLAGDMADMRLVDDSDDVDMLLEQASALRQVIPAIDDWGFAHHIAGLSMYTPDGKFVIGPVPGVPGLVVAGGCCGSGVAASGGFGQAVADLVAGREPSIDIRPFRPDRFGAVDPSSTEFREVCAAARARDPERRGT